ncbi:MAG: hypothetical protein Q4A66_10370 [Eubacteriales bacterium]|nr:hypothetical protein [Eubacteriales bacterium]
MAFWGCSFSFRGVSCRDYGLMIYNIGSGGDAENMFASTVSIEEELVGSHWKPYFVGVRYQEKLRVSFTFGVDQDRLDARSFLSRREASEIAAWLTGHDDYGQLRINQEDMLDYHYKCMCTSLTLLQPDGAPWAFRAEFTCDSPYAYLRETAATYSVSGTASAVYDCRTSHNGYISPNVSISLSSGGSFSIANAADAGRVMTFSNVPASVSRIDIDCDKCIITNDQDLNLYENFNFQFLRLRRGENNLTFSGNGAVTISGEFPINIGG